MFARIAPRTYRAALSGLSRPTMSTASRLNGKFLHYAVRTSATTAPNARPAFSTGATAFAAFAGFVLGFGGLGVAHAENAAANKAEELYAKGKGDKHAVHDYLVSVVAKEPDNADALWRLARACHDLVALESNMEQKKKIVYQAHEYAKKALELAPDNFATHKWFAITLSSIGDYEGTKASIQNAYVVREHFETALRLNPKDATTHHLLGLWHFTIAGLPWYTAKIASALFATPPTSDFETALRCFQTAEELDPGFYKKNAVMIGDTLDQLKRPEEAQEWFRKAVAMPIDNADDQAAHDDALKKLKA